MKVIKRNNIESEVDIKEIREALIWACSGLDIDFLEIESHIDTIYRDKITTTEIQHSLIETTLKLTCIERPDFRIVASRLLLMDYYKEAKKLRSFEKLYKNYHDFVKSAVEKGFYSKKILSLYSLDELIAAGNLINPNYDMDFDYAGATLLINRYLIRDGGKPFELPQEMFLTISLYLAAEEKNNRMDIVKKIYNAVAGRKISLATPILINLRRDSGNLSSCFISAIDDSLDSIFYNINTVAQISKNGGGVGLNISRVRANGATIKNVPDASGGVIPWIKIINDTAVAVNQLGKRAGAVTVALDLWHLDLIEFLELQTETGDQRKKAYDIFPQLVVPDLFMRRVEDRENWTLFDPFEVYTITGKRIAELWGEDFEKLYIDLETMDGLKKKRVIPAIEIFKIIMKSQVETGMPYLFFKDSVNKANPNSHDGYIGSGNLCQESFSNFKPSRVEKPLVEKGCTTQNSYDGQIHTCNLLSLNLANIDGDKELRTLTRLGIHILDNAIELTDSPVPESIIHNNRYRTVGLGAMGLADYLAKNSIIFEKSEDFIDDLFERIALYALEMSCDLAKVRGAYKAFKGSGWEHGLLFNKTEDWFRKNSNYYRSWKDLINNIKQHGIRNGQLLAIAPNTSSSLLQGCSPGILPIYSKFHVDKNANGAIPICPPYIKSSFWFYKESKNIDQKRVVSVVSRIQKWIDQGISMEILYNLNKDITALDIYETLFEAWRSGCKTVYYTRTIQKNGNIPIEKEVCVSCAN